MLTCTVLHSDNIETKQFIRTRFIRVEFKIDNKKKDIVEI